MNEIVFNQAIKNLNPSYLKLKKNPQIFLAPHLVKFQNYLLLFESRLDGRENQLLSCLLIRE